jgi:hypothetical protein
MDQPEKFSDFFTTANERRRLMGSDPASDYRSFELSQPIQYADEEWLNKLMESRRLRDEAIKQGGYAEGGEVHADHPDIKLKAIIDARFANAEGMAEGGEVESADARLKAAIDARLGQHMDGNEPHMGVGGLLNKAIKAVKGAQEVLPAVEREANLAKFLEESAVKNRVYHGTMDDVRKFSDKKLGQNTDSNASSEGYAQTARVGHWFNTNPMGQSPEKHGAGYTVDMPVYLSIKNPKREMNLDWLAQGLESKKGRAYRKELEKQGYDGLVLPDEEFGGESYVAFRPEQIKSAIGNRGTYDINEADITKANGGLAHFAAGGSSRRKADVTEALTEGLAPMLYGGAKGALASLLGFPGELEQLGRTGINFSFGSGPGHRGIDVGEEPFLPNTKRVSGALPNYRGSKVANEVAEMGTDLGENIVGTMLDPMTVIKGAKPVLNAAKMLSGSRALPATAQAQRGVIKMPGGNWLNNSVENSLKGLKRNVSSENLANYTPEQVAQLTASGRLAKNDALNNWVDRNLTNYVKKQMATPDDPVRKLAEQGIVHIPSEQVGVNRYRAPKHREAYGGEQLGKSEAARAWEDASDVAINAPRARAIKENESLYQANPWIEKLSPEDRVYALNRPASTQHEISGLGFDHIMDVLREDVASGRIRPEQLNKVSMEQAVRRTYEYDQEMARKMRETQAKVTEGMPVHKDYPDKGYKWIELTMPQVSPERMAEGDPKAIAAFLEQKKQMGMTDAEAKKALNLWAAPPEYKTKLEEALKYEGDTMGHCVGGYCPDVLAGRSRIYSLRDAKGEPHVTVEVNPVEKHPIGYGMSGGNNFPNDFRYERGSISPEQHQQIYQRAKELFDPKSTKDIGNHRMDVFQQAADEIIGKPSEQIAQIKGKQNRAPKEEYLPYVQDFVKSGNWSDVGDLGNTGLRPIDTVPERARFESAGMKLPKYVTDAEHDNLINEYIKLTSPPIDPMFMHKEYGFPLPEGMKRGGPVNIEQEYKFKKFRK